MYLRSMRGSSGISDHFIVKIKVRFRLSVKWQEKIGPVKIRINIVGGKQMVDDVNKVIIEI